MGNPKQKWTPEEEEALRAGIAKHGTGKWKNIQRDPEFNHLLFSRSNIDLKDKWRNMSVSTGGQNPREKSRTPKPKVISEVPTAPLSITPSATPFSSDASKDQVLDDSKSVADNKTAPKYNALISEAILTLNEPNGSDTSAIFRYIEKKEKEVPHNFRRLLSSRIRRLVAQDKLERVENCYKVKKESLPGTKTSTPKQEEIRPKQLQSIPYIDSEETIEEAAVAAAYKIAEAENKSFVAAEAVKEAERISKMAEDTDSMLQLAKEIFEKCSRGEIVLMA